MAFQLMFLGFWSVFVLSACGSTQGVLINALAYEQYLCVAFYCSKTHPNRPFEYIEWWIIEAIQVRTLPMNRHRQTRESSASRFHVVEFVFCSLEPILSLPSAYKCCVTVLRAGTILSMQFQIMLIWQKENAKNGKNMIQLSEYAKLPAILRLAEWK